MKLMYRNIFLLLFLCLSSWIAAMDGGAGDKIGFLRFNNVKCRVQDGARACNLSDLAVVAQQFLADLAKQTNHKDHENLQTDAADVAGKARQLFEQDSSSPPVDMQYVNDIAYHTKLVTILHPDEHTLKLIKEKSRRGQALTRDEGILLAVSCSYRLHPYDTIRAYALVVKQPELEHSDFLLEWAKRRIEQDKKLEASGHIPKMPTQIEAGPAEIDFSVKGELGDQDDEEYFLADVPKRSIDLSGCLECLDFERLKDLMEAQGINVQEVESVGDDDSSCEYRVESCCDCDGNSFDSDDSF